MNCIKDRLAMGGEAGGVFLLDAARKGLQVELVTRDNDTIYRNEFDQILTAQGVDTQVLASFPQSQRLRRAVHSDDSGRVSRPLPGLRREALRLS